MEKTRISELKTKLLSSPDILGREGYVNTAVLVPLLLIDGVECLLFERRAPHIKQGNEICFPGGHFDGELDSSYLDTALRETREELGINSSSVEIIGQLDTLVTPRGVIIESYFAAVELTNPADLQIDRTEVDEVFTVPLSWFFNNPPEVYHTRVEIQSSYKDSNGNERILLPVEELGLPSRYKKNRSEWKHRVIVYKKNPHIIWGLTAAIVYNLVQKIYT